MPPVRDTISTECRQTQCWRFCFAVLVIVDERLLFTVDSRRLSGKVSGDGNSLSANNSKNEVKTMKPSSPKTVLATAVMAVMTAEAAFAQLEEVVVTAERREASVQDTPISIEAISEKSIRERGIQSNLDLINEVAGVQGYGSPQGGSSTAFAIRGIGDGAPQISVDPAAARYIDGVYIGKNQGGSVDVTDLARIEVLRGPQGTLSGRNSISGAINYISKAPADELGLEIRATAGNYEQNNISVRADVPVNDTLRTSMSYFSRERDAFWDNTNPNEDGFNSVDREGGRFAFQWDASDKLTIDAAYNKSEVNDELDNHAVVTGFNPTTAAIGGYFAAGGDLLNVPINSTTQRDTVAGIITGLQTAIGFASGAIPANLGGPGLNPALTDGSYPIATAQTVLGWANDFVAWSDDRLANFDNNPGTGSSDGGGFASVDNELITFKATYDINDDVQVRYIYGKREFNDYTVSDLDGMDNSVASGIQSFLTIATAGGALSAGLPNAVGGTVSGIIPEEDGGLFFIPAQHQLATDLVDAVVANGAGDVFSTIAANDYTQESHEIQVVGTTGDYDWSFGAYSWQDYGEFRNIQTPTYGLAASQSRGFDVGGEAFSLFAESTWHATPDWDFTVGLRYTEEDKYMTYRWRDFPKYPDAFGGSSTQGVGGYIGLLFGLPNFLPAPISPEFLGLGNGYINDLDDLGMIPETAGVYGDYNRQSFDNISGRLVAKYNISDNMNAYVSYTTGYRAGGFNGGAFDGGGDAFDEETLESFEVGLKSQLMDGKLRLNAALYSYTYDDVQVSTVKSNGGGISTEIDNAAELSSEGLELDFAWLLTDSVTLTGNYAYIDRSFDVFPAIQNANPDIADQQITPTNGITPESAAYLALNWAIMDTGSTSLDFQISGNYQDETISIGSSPSNYSMGTSLDPTDDIPVNYQQAPNQSRTIVNARLTWGQDLGDGRSLSIAAWGRNITEEDYRTFGYNFGADLGIAVHQWGDPATYGVDIVMDF
jgi:iron complex outermembrane receptor protein